MTLFLSRRCRFRRPSGEGRDRLRLAYPDDRTADGTSTEAAVLHSRPAAARLGGFRSAPSQTCPGRGAGRVIEPRSPRMNAASILLAALAAVVALSARSDERRVGKEWVSTCRSRGWP